MTPKRPLSEPPERASLPAQTKNGRPLAKRTEQEMTDEEIAEIPEPPSGLSPRGESFWRRTVEDFELEAGALELLTEVCRALDHLTELDEASRRDGVMIASSQGMRLHPAIAEHRALSLAVARMLSQLALPDEDGEPAVASANSAAARARQARLSEQSRVGR